MVKEKEDLAEEIKSITHLSNEKLAELKELLNEIKHLRRQKGDKPSEKLKGFIAKLQPYCREIVLKGGKDNYQNILGVVSKDELAINKGLPEYMKTIIETWLFMGTIPNDDLEYWALPSKEQGKALTFASNYAIDLNLLRIPAFAFRKTPKTKHFIDYKETRIIHGRSIGLVTRVGTAYGALTAFDYGVFRAVSSFIKVAETENGKQYFAAFTMSELLQRLGKGWDFYKVTYEALLKLPTLHIRFSHYFTGKDKEPEHLTVNYFEKVYTPPKHTPEREHKFLFNQTTGRVFSNKLYREFIFENIARFSEPLTMRLYEMIETALYQKTPDKDTPEAEKPKPKTWNISFDKLAARIPLPDKNTARRDKKIIKALEQLKGLYHYTVAGGYLTLRKQESLFNIPAAQKSQTDETKELPEQVKWIEPEDFM